MGVAQIIVTAATPMGEEKGKEFPPVKTQSESSEEDHGIIIEKPEEEAAEEDQPMDDDFDDFSADDDEDEEGFEPPKMPPPPLPPQAKVAKGVTIIKPLPPPKIDPFAENEKTDAQKPDVPKAADAGQNEHFFEANFDEAFQDDPDAPKVVTGGRASIPDELAPHQLARLQNLKESNA